MKLLVFGGTIEGRQLFCALAAVAGVSVTLSVTTEYGRSLALAAAGSAPVGQLKVLVGRMGRDEMRELIKQEAYDYVIDATHPYATSITESIRSVCQDVGQRYLRLKRPPSTVKPIYKAPYMAPSEPCPVVGVPDARAAAALLNKHRKKVLLTIGSKQLEPFCAVTDYAERIFVRILPMPDSLEKAISLGFCISKIIAMQGPFDEDMNRAMIRMCGAEVLVTKDSGDMGGFRAKGAAASALGCELIVIRRPSDGDGLELDELLGLLGVSSQEKRQTAKQEPALRSAAPFFPLFVDLRGRQVLVVGAGVIAERRIRALLAFGADVVVIAPEASEYIRGAAATGSVCWRQRQYLDGDVAALQPFVVLTATNQRQVNQAVMLEAKSLSLPVSVADSRHECTCQFPALVEGEEYLAGLISKNGDHTGLRKMAERMRELLNR
ncbi:MAG: precorrin-6A reductase [Actinomycetia bacterium]|nr:precorrin-6A reductase [Actinomycetes bacterium]